MGIRGVANAAGTAKTGGGPPSFEDLLRQLSAAHERQREVVRQLREENASLLERRRERPCSALGQKQEVIRLLLEDRVSARRSGKEQPGPGLEGSLPPPQPPEDWDFPQDESEREVFSDCRESRRDDSCRKDGGGDEEARRHNTLWLVPELWPEWLPVPGEARVLTRAVTADVREERESGHQRASCCAALLSRCLQRLVIRPSGAFRLVWECLSSLVVCFDVIGVPLMAVSLERDRILGGGMGALTEAMDFVAPLFWTLDMPCSLFTGFQADGVTEMRAWEVAKRYLTTWFAFDLLLALVDWAVAYENSLGEGAHVFRTPDGKYIHMVCMLRTMRLLRAVKLHGFLNRCLEAISFAGLRAALHATATVLCIFTLNHYLACGWFLVGHVGWQLDAPNWIDESRLIDRTVSYAYFTSLHWSMTQFTPASMEIRPYNVAERVYNIVCLLFALVAISSYLGSITASISDLRKHSSAFRRQQFMLRAYLSKNNVPASLCKRIWSYLRKHYNQRMGASKFEKLEVLRLLPADIYDALNLELYGPYLTRAPFFYQYRIFSKQGLMELCSRCIAELTLVCEEPLFLQGKRAERMYFTVSGFMRYGHRNEKYRHVLGSGSWASEPVLWVQWVHAASMTASTSCEILTLESAEFRSLMGQFKESLAFVRAYARAFRDHLQRRGLDEQTDVMTDMQEFESLTQLAVGQVEFFNAQGTTTTPTVRPRKVSRLSGFWDHGSLQAGPEGSTATASHWRSSRSVVWRRLLAQSTRTNG
mmetsp:Transcript_72679/g.213020  ORF Transcript_72679/g.213020 Transcript_72679/m.213020 type:complete len:763 (-) Transcript_72679:27-2315(-)